jgi:methylmalonyl-CoA mutase N-terminal domain/subunit
LGGTQSLHTNSKDEALNLPSEGAVLTALRTQQLIAEESGVCDTIDPLGGSYFIEKLTDELEGKIRELMERIENRGGMIKAIEAQFPQKEIERSAYQYQKSVEIGEITVVGVNKYTEAGSVHPGEFRVDPSIAERQRERLETFKEKRDNSSVARLLDEIEEAARGKVNLMPPIIAAVKGNCTLGEISGAMEKVFGRYSPGARTS